MDATLLMYNLDSRISCALAIGSLAVRNVRVVIAMAFISIGNNVTGGVGLYCVNVWQFLFKDTQLSTHFSPTGLQELSHTLSHLAFPFL